MNVGEYQVPLAVNRIGFQTFRDFRVVYARVGDIYEVRREFADRYSSVRSGATS